MRREEGRGGRRTAADGLLLAVGTLTAVPVPAPSRIDRSVARWAMTLAPIAVLPLAVLVAGVAALGHWLPPGVTAALLVGALALGTRGLHLDGLADTADGLAASYDRERALTIMRKGDTGPAGMAAVVLVLAGQITAAAAVLAHPGGWLLAGGAVCASRLALWAACSRWLPSARTAGLGATVAGVLPGPTSLLAPVLAGATLAGACAVTGRSWWLGPLAAAVAAIAVGSVLLRCRRRLGGITGDVLGAAVETAFAGLLVGLAVA